MAPLRLASPAVIGVLWVLLPIVSASAADFGITARPRMGLVLSGRQNSGVPEVPPECAATCNPINGILETGTCDPAQCCTPLFESGYFNCLLCVGKADNATTSDFAQAQSLVDNLIVACSKLGFVIPDLTLPGQNSSRIIPTASAGSAGSALPRSSQIIVTALPSTIASSTHSQVTISTLPSSVQLPGSTASLPPTTTGGGVKAGRPRIVAYLLMIGGGVFIGIVV
ncbi:hypothetical protein C8F01DRAFT_1246445 [Mycena amicta]|nr:hypothetical protein C8F01DRAFT_1246445 [Mycena amicta]